MIFVHGYASSAEKLEMGLFWVAGILNADFDSGTSQKTSGYDLDISPVISGLNRRNELNARKERVSRPSHTTGAGRNNGGHRLQLLLSPDARDLLKQLKEVSEAESYGELVRRALIALELFEPVAAGGVENVVEMPAGKRDRTMGCTERLQIVLPERSMRRLEELKAQTATGNRGSAYSEIIRSALKVYAQLYRDLGKLDDQSLTVSKKENMPNRSQTRLRLVGVL